jgi:RNA polymerase sigma factor (sigma-70 family)
VTRKPDRILTEWLVLQVQCGNRKAWETLLRLWYPMLKRFALTRVGHREDAQDAVQEALLKMAAGIGSLRDPAAFPGWAYSILDRRCADQLRYRQERGQRHTDEPVPEGAAANSDNTSADLFSDMHNALQRLKPDSYLVVHLYYLHDLGLDEIAAITQAPVGTVKSRLFTARQSLKRHLGGYEDE